VISARILSAAEPQAQEEWKYHHEVIHELGSPTEDENADLRHAGMDCRYPGRKDASGDIRVNLDSSAPCCNDGIERFCLN
jgi:hypothetical protein